MSFLREEAQAKLAALEDPRDLAFKKPFYEAAIITCDALAGTITVNWSIRQVA